MFARARLFLAGYYWCNGVDRGGRRGVLFFCSLMQMKVASYALANGGHRTGKKPRLKRSKRFLLPVHMLFRCLRSLLNVLRS